MFATRLFKITGRFKKNVNFHLETKILSSKNVIILNRAFLCTEEEVLKSDEVKSTIRHRVDCYRRYLLKNSAYSNYLFKQDTKNPRVAALLNQLQQDNENNLSIKNEVAENLEKEVATLDFNEFCEILFRVVNFKNNKPDDPSLVKMSRFLDNECYMRIASWSTNEIIKMGDAAVQLKPTIRALSKIFLKLSNTKLNVHETVLLFYFLIKKNFDVPKELHFDIQERIVKFLPELNSTELGIITAGLSRTFSFMTSRDVVPAILRRGLECIDSMDEEIFKNICWLAIIYKKNVSSDEVVEFQEKASDAANKFGAKSLIILALTGEKYSYLNPKLKAMVLKEAKDHVKEIPDVYIARAAHLITAFSIQDDEFLKLAVAEFESRASNKIWGKALVQFLASLPAHKIYPKKLIDLALRQDFVYQFSGLLHIHLWWKIYCTVEIEKPEYKTFELNLKDRNRIYNLSKLYFKIKYPKYPTFLNNIKQIVEELHGKDTANHFMPLPHCPMGLLIIFDKNLKPQKLQSDFDLASKGSIIKPLKDDRIWLFLTSGKAQTCSDYPHILPSLLSQANMRQLSALGYAPVFMYKNAWAKGNIKEYLENIISAKLQESCKDQINAVCK